MREVVTVQVGGFANFVGSHFWNFQDELLGLADDPAADAAFRTAPLDMDVLYRTGETLQVEPGQELILNHASSPSGRLSHTAYCPRLVSVGSRGSLGSLSSSGAPSLSSAASDQLNVTTWSGNVTRSVEKPHERNLFLQSLTEQEPNPSTSNGGNNSQKSVEDKDLVECLEKDVNFWTDYTKVQYHPQSLYEMYGSWTDFDKFDNFGTAREVVSEWSLMEEMNEKLRFFVEECDHIQGIQFIVDDSGGFSSIAATYLENIADDYTSTPVLLYCVRDPVTHGSSRNQRDTITRSLHDAVSLSKLSSFCSLMVPIGLPSLSQSSLSPFLSIQDAKPFHSSAISAAAIHSVTVPFRLQNAGPASNIAHSSGNIDMRELVHIISDQGRQNMVTALDVAMPAPSLKDGNDLWNMKSMHTLTPEISDEEEDPYSVESLVVHGVLRAGGQRASISQVKDSVYSAYEGRATKPKFSHLSVSPCPLPIPLPFPSIFRSNIGQHGEILSNHAEGTQPKGSLDVESIPMAARLRSSNAVLPFIERRSLSLQKFGVARGALGTQILRDWGFGREEMEDMGEHLSKMVRAFHPEGGLTSDSD